MLDLGGAASHDSLWDPHDRVSEVVHVDAVDGGLDGLTKAGERFDSIFSVFRLAAADDIDTLLGHVHRLLSPDGFLLFLEPGRSPGAAGRVQRLASPGVARATGWRADVDIPGRLRAAGLSITDIERHRPGTVQWWIRMLVEGSAHHSLLH